MAVEELAQSKADCEFACPHGKDSRERAAEEDFVRALKGDAPADPRITVREKAAKADLRKQ